MKSQIESGVLIKFDRQDLVNGHFECSKVRKIGEFAFINCEDLSSISLPNVESIGMGAFYNCKNLKNIYFPHAVNISSYVFRSCANLASIHLPQVI